MALQVEKTRGKVQWSRKPQAQCDIALLIRGLSARDRFSDARFPGVFPGVLSEGQWQNSADAKAMVMEASKSRNQVGGTCKLNE